MNMSVNQIKKEIKKRGVSLLSICFVDFSGATRAKCRPSSLLDVALTSGVRFATPMMAFTAHDTLCSNSGFTVASGDIILIPDPKTFSIPSYAQKTGRFIADLYNENGNKWEFCPRNAFRKVLKIAEKMGYRFHVGSELEFHIITREGERMIPYETGVVQTQYGFDITQELFQQYIEALTAMNALPIKFNVEGGTGQLEISLKHQEGLKAADDIVTGRDAIRAVSHMNGLIGTFVPKLGDKFWGTGLHIHNSLANVRNGRNSFSDPNDERGFGLSQTCYYYIGGILEHTRALCAIASPTVNSYKRLKIGSWNADAVVYGLGHRGAAVRVPPERNLKGTESLRVEVRFPDATCNPYLALAGILAAGLDGIKKKIEPGDPVNYDMSLLGEDELKRRGLKLMPKSLYEALEELESDNVLLSGLGKALMEEYIKIKKDEWDAYCRQVFSWEVEKLINLF